MNIILLLSVIIPQACLAFSQNSCENDSSFKEIRFPLTGHYTPMMFYYFNNEWIAGASVEMIDPDSILNMEVKNDEYGNRTVFITISSDTLEKLKSDVKEATKDIWPNYDPICEFPGGSGKFKEWLEANIRIPDGYIFHTQEASHRLYSSNNFHRACSQFFSLTFRRADGR